MVRHEPGELVSVVVVKGDLWRAVTLDRESGEIARDTGFDRKKVRREAYRAAMLVAVLRKAGFSIDGLKVFHPPGFAKP